jgi:predicted glycoside hydrolase/deacetylase ChbG (UPF0249 family)
MNLAEKLGYSSDAKLLIIHADDFGLSHSTNRAIAELFKENAITSASVMVPCPWFPEAAYFAKDNGDLDIGIHLTLTSEWDNFFFGGVLERSQIPSLLNEKGYFYPSSEDFLNHFSLQEVEKEINAQIERALYFGIEPTHLDSHMFTLHASTELLDLLVQTGKKYKLPVFIPLNMLSAIPEAKIEAVKKENIVVENFFFLEISQPENEWEKPYLEVIKNLQPGLNEIILHPAYDTEENRAIMRYHDDFGSKWRQNDLNFLRSKELQHALKDNDVKLITWRQIGKAIY